MFLKIFKIFKSKLMMLHISRRPNWDEIHQLLKQVSVTQDRIAKQQERAAQRQEARDLAWRAKQDELQAAWELRRAQEAQQQAQQRAKEREEDRLALAKQRAENSKAFKELWRVLNGTNKHTGRIAEQYFRRTIQHNQPFCIQGISFHAMSTGVPFRFNGYAMECDILLKNEKFIAIVEVKHFLKQGHVYEFNHKLNKIVPIVLPRQYRHLQIMPVLACVGLQPKAEIAARVTGMALLRPGVQKCQVECDHLDMRPPVDKSPNP